MEIPRKNNERSGGDREYYFIHQGRAVRVRFTFELPVIPGEPRRYIAVLHVAAAGADSAREYRLTRGQLFGRSRERVCLRTTGPTYVYICTHTRDKVI